LFLLDLRGAGRIGDEKLVHQLSPMVNKKNRIMDMEVRQVKSGPHVGGGVIPDLGHMWDGQDMP